MTEQQAENDTVARAAEEHAKHLANYRTQYDGRGGVRWQDDGGLHCTCGWTAPPDPQHGYRPWSAWHYHVVEMVLTVAAGLQGEQKWAVAHDDPTPYMDGPRTTRLREVSNYDQAEAMLEILQARSEKSPRNNMRIQTRRVTPWEDVT